MQSLLAQIKTHIAAAITTGLGDDAHGIDPQVHPAGDPKFGDYQCNAAMGLAKKLGRKPRDIAASIADSLPEAALSMLETPQIAGPGFINLRLKNEFIQTTLESIPPAPKDEADQGRNSLSPRLGRGTDRLGIEPVIEQHKQTVVVDYSSPNVAKQMHVGHLRSTVIGDTIARVLEFEGHDVIRQNHLGDWGTPMGMVIVACMSQAARQEKKRTGTVTEDHLDSPEFAISMLNDSGNIALLEELYKVSAQSCKDDASYRARVLEVTKQLQASDPEIVMVWKKARELSLAAAFDLYDRLKVELGMDSVRGESFYEPFLTGVVEELRDALQSRDRQGADQPTIQAETQPLPHGRGSEKNGRSDMLRAVCREDQGAVCVFLESPDGTPAFKGPQGDPLPMIIQKSDGAFLYSTTDLAAILFRIAHKDRHRIELRTRQLQDNLNKLGGGLGADRVIYVVGSPQKLHFEMLFPVAHATGWTVKGQHRVQLEHVSFGSILGENRKMLRTRTGENVKLADLLDEAVRRAGELVRRTEADTEKRRGFSEDEIKAIAETTGIAAVKYADLSQNRNSDYVFNWDKMLALQGNTAPYLLYAYARIRSIYRKGTNEKPFDIDADSAALCLGHAAERSLALAILRLPEVLDGVADHLMPNFLCEYLYELAGRFMVFYESCPVLKAPDEHTRATRLRLCDHTGRALKLGLGLLGIPTLERM